LPRKTERSFTLSRTSEKTADRPNPKEGLIPAVFAESIEGSSSEVKSKEESTCQKEVVRLAEEAEEGHQETKKRFGLQEEEGRDVKENEASICKVQEKRKPNRRLQAYKQKEKRGPDGKPKKEEAKKEALPMLTPRKARRRAVPYGFRMIIDDGRFQRET